MVNKLLASDSKVYIIPISSLIMLKVIFDTNIYGFLIKESKIDIIRKKILKDENFVICGFKQIRKELRDTPRTEKLGKLSTRNLLLCLYDD